MKVQKTNIRMEFDRVLVFYILFLTGCVWHLWFHDPYTLFISLELWRESSFPFSYIYSLCISQLVDYVCYWCQKVVTGRAVAPYGNWKYKCSRRVCLELLLWLLKTRASSFAWVIGKSGRAKLRRWWQWHVWCSWR